MGSPLMVTNIFICFNIVKLDAKVETAVHGMDLTVLSQFVISIGLGGWHIPL